MTDPILLSPEASAHVGIIGGHIYGRGLADYPLAHSARAELARRLGRAEEARASYERALALTRQDPQRRFLERRLADL